MSEITLESLGLNQDQLIERLVDKIAGNLMESLQYDEDGDEWRSKSGFAKKLDAMVKDRLNKIVTELADKHVLPRVGEMVENMSLQETTRWGEKVGRPVTFIEYLTQRADAYMREEVNYEGKPKGTDSYSWTARGTRAAYMIHKHLDHHIGTAMQQALANVNSSIANGLHETVKIQLAEVLAKLKVEVKTR